MSTPEAMEACLAWIVAGAIEWYAAERSIGPDPESVERAVTDWRMESDLLLRYLTQRCEFVPDSCVSSSVLHADFAVWLRGQGHPGSWPQRTFTARLKDHSGLPAPVRLAQGVRFDSVNVSMPHVEPGEWLGNVPKLPRQGAAWWGIRFRKDPED
jgi:phage/plasmid-associated DNA primase